MHVWVVEVKDFKDSDWEVDNVWLSRDVARNKADNLKRSGFVYKTRVVKYISTKGD